MRGGGGMRRGGRFRRDEMNHVLWPLTNIQLSLISSPMRKKFSHSQEFLKQKIVEKGFKSSSQWLGFFHSRGEWSRCRTHSSESPSRVGVVVVYATKAAPPIHTICITKTTPVSQLRQRWRKKQWGRIRSNCDSLSLYTHRIFRWIV